MTGEFANGDEEKVWILPVDNLRCFSKIELLKLNIEGGEYELLESLLENDCITYFKNIQVQFHDFLFDNAKERMTKIQEQLSKTHELTYQYEFVWENWKLK